MHKPSTGWNTACIKNDYFSYDKLKSCPERFVIVGFIAADGCISQPAVGQDQLIFSLSAKDRIALEKINEEIAGGNRAINESNVKCQNCKTYPAVRLYLPSNQICSDLARYGIIPRKTKTLPFPDLTEPAMRYFLRGYFYGDGCVYNTGKGSIRYSIVGRKVFCQAIKDYLISSRIIDTAGLYDVRRKEKDTGYANLDIYGRQAELLGKYLFFDDKLMLLPRKHVKIKIPIQATHWTREETDQIIACQSYPELKNLCQKIGRSYSTAKAKRLEITHQPFKRYRQKGISWTQKQREGGIQAALKRKMNPSLKDPKTGRFISRKG